MSFHSETLIGGLRALEARAALPARYFIAFSGGLDSTVLLHALVRTRDRHRVPLAAMHVDHGLHPESARWAAAAQRFSEAQGVPCVVERIAVAASGAGPEAAAREARYRALQQHMGPGDWLLSAHHQDDQAETLLLNLLRGSGPAGLAAMPSIREFGPGYLARPLLAVTRGELADYAAAEGLAWNEDPSNADVAFDRNFLRNAALPVLHARWPDTGRRLARSAALARESAELLRELADDDLRRLDDTNGRRGALPVAGLRRLSRPRAANLLRRAVARANLPPPPAGRLDSILDSLLVARDDANPVVRWPGAECRRFREHVYLLPSLPAPDFEERRLAPGEPAALGAGFGTLSLEETATMGIAPAIAASGLRLRARRGGEEIRPVGQPHTRKLKKLLQDQGVFPWLRDALPLVYAGDELVAVADLWIAEKAAAAPGFAVRWEAAPTYMAHP